MGSGSEFEDEMRTIRALAVVGLVVMVAMIGFAVASGSFVEEGAAIWGLAWGKVTLVDLYVGLVFFGVWVAWRERSWAATALWWVALAGLGNLAAAVYLVRAAFGSEDVRELLTGERTW